MTKQIEVHGQRVKVYSLDEGRSWSSSPQSIVAYGQRKTMLRLELQKSFERIDEVPEPKSYNITEHRVPSSTFRR
jgi:hypothetical protein